CTFTVTVTDNDAPVLAGCNNVSTTTDPASACSAVVTYALPTATDNCDTGLTVSCLPASGSTFPKGPTTVTCTATDTSSNTGSCTFTVTVTDNDAPVLAGCNNVSATNDPASACSALVTYALPTAPHTFPTRRSANRLPASGSTFAKGPTTVTCT